MRAGNGPCHLVEGAQFAGLEVLAQGLQGGVVALDVPDAADHPGLVERPGQLEAAGDVVGERLLDQGVHAGRGQGQPELAVEAGRGGHDAHVDAPGDQGVNVGQHG